MKTQIREDQWLKIYGKVKNLLYTIASKISGDPALCDIEDLESDLKIIIIEAINGFSKKTGQTLDEFIDSKLFNQYLKTSLWNYKNNRGAKIQKKRNIRKFISLDSDSESYLKSGGKDSSETGLNVVDKKINETTETEIEEFFSCLTKQELHIIEVITENPDLVKKNGKINRTLLCEIQNKNWREVDADLDRISKLVGIEL
jgi:hypothetical protein